MSFIKAKALEYVASSRQIYVDAANGSDVAEHGRGGKLQPYATVEAALAAIVADPTLTDYTLMLAPGAYGTGPIAWPVAAGKNISVFGDGENCSLTTPITYTALGGVAEENVSFYNVGVSDITIDLAAAAAAAKVAQVEFINCGVNLNRTDSTPSGGPQLVRLFTCFINGLQTSGVVTITGCQYIGGPINIAGPNGVLLSQASFLAGAGIVVGGTLAVAGTLLAGSNLSGAGTFIADATSLYTGFAPASNTVATQVFSDDATKLAFTPATPTDWELPPATVQAALDQLAYMGVGTRNSFVYKPGGFTGGNTYATWAELIAKLQAIQGPKTIYIDDSLVSPAVIPAGAYDFTDVTLAGGRTDTITTLSFADGVQITNLRKITGPMFVGGNNTVTPIESISAGANQLLDLGPGVFISNAGTQPIWEVANVSLSFLFTAAVQFVAGTIVNVITGGSFVGTQFNTSGIGANTISDDGTGTLNVASDANSNMAAQAGFTGVLVSSNADSASKVAFVPAVPGDWLTPPTQVAQALDELAAAASAAIAANFSVVASNGSDVTGDGSWAKPYATIQNAITQAVADGAGFANQWEILVLPSAVPYAGFSTANGVNVKGLHSDRQGVIVQEVVIVPDGSGLATNSVELANLSIVAGGVGQSINLGGADATQLYVRNCSIRQGSGFSNVLINQGGSTVEFDNCEFIHAGIQDALQIAAGSVSCINNCTMLSGGIAVDVQGGVFESHESYIESTGGGVAALSVAAPTDIQFTRVINSGVAAGSPAIEVTATGALLIQDCILDANAASPNINVIAGGTVQQANVNLEGVSTTVANAGTITDVPVFRQRPLDYVYQLQAADIVNQYIDLPQEVVGDSIVFRWDAGLPPLNTRDYTVAVVGGVTRISFVLGGTLNTTGAAGQYVEINALY